MLTDVQGKPCSPPDECRWPRQRLHCFPQCQLPSGERLTVDEQIDDQKAS